MSIKCIFYSYFDADKGPRVLYQVPENSVTPSSDNPSQPPSLFSFDEISDYIIPKQQLCDRLITFCRNRYRLLGYPICLEDDKYDRNEFIFNFVIVLDESEEFSSYKPVVKKLARLFKALEEQMGFLWNEVTRSSVYTLIEQVMEDLNSYLECMIPINESNTINLKLFPAIPPPPPVKAYHVPISTVRFESIMDSNWDLTMQRIIPFIDGVNSVRRISELADADYTLTKKCISELLYYGCIIIVDVFRFANIYAVNSELYNFVNDGATATTSGGGLQEECQAYISNTGRLLDFPAILDLYTSLRQGLTVGEWSLENAERLKDVDVRRFIQFGIIKGFLYRVHKYPVRIDDGTGAVATVGPATAAVGSSVDLHALALGHGPDTAGVAGSVPGPKMGKSVTTGSGILMADRSLPLLRYLDGAHHFDSICTDLQQSEKDVLKNLAAYPIELIDR
ncbi:Nitrogen permease regulator 2 [Arthrobotrys conoides]|uniref:Nitrogen permease regulator 2 n=1 Tax=Arthrobotrys conoides TaxID=74498 RepID=A0AAN8NVA6_9PEZI